MTEASTFKPNWISSPGDTIAEILVERGLSLKDFARQIGASLDRAGEITKGIAQIDQPMAERLQHVLGPSATFWVNRERQYRVDAARLDSSKRGMTDREWLRQLPVSDMIRFGWIKPARTFSDKTEACLRFFSVPDVVSWHERYRGELSVAAFRTSPTFVSNPGAVLAWLRWAELRSKEIACDVWDPDKFGHRLTEMRILTKRKEPGRFLPELRRMCAQCGVALVVARAPTGCRASGATRFLTPEKAMIALSFRYRTDDQFWFTFFHEAGHLLLHGKKALFLEDDSEVTSSEEAEANEFAGRILIPQESVPTLMRLGPNVREIIRFAIKVGVSPGIVVGQLQHLGRIRPNRLNGLKRRYRWSAMTPEGLSL